jgi:hypothetical protein
MASMSYCRFENTTIDFGYCIDDVRRMIDLEQKGLVGTELVAFKKLVKQAQELLQMVADYEYRSDDVLEFNFDSCIDQLCEEASIEQDDEDNDCDDDGNKV